MAQTMAVRPQERASAFVESDFAFWALDTLPFLGLVFLVIGAGLVVLVHRRTPASPGLRQDHPAWSLVLVFCWPILLPSAAVLALLIALRRW